MDLLHWDCSDHHNAENRYNRFSPSHIDSKREIDLRKESNIFYEIDVFL